MRGTGFTARSAHGGHRPQLANRIFLNVLNKSFDRPVQVSFQVEGMRIAGGRACEVAPEDHRTSMGLDLQAVFTPIERTLGPSPWRFAPASVSALESEVK